MRKFIAAFGLWLLVTVAVDATDDSDLFNNLPSDTPFVIKIKDVQGVIDWLQQDRLRDFDSDGFHYRKLLLAAARRLEKLGDDKLNSVIESVVNGDIPETIEKLLDSLKKAKDAIVLVNVDKDQVAAICLFELEKQEIEAVSGCLNRINEFLAAWFHGSPKNEISFPFSRTGRIEFRSIGKYFAVFLGESKEFSEFEIENPKNKLIETRKFKKTRSLLRKALVGSTFEVYAVPKQIRPLLGIRSNEWIGYRAQEVPLVGAAVKLNSDADDTEPLLTSKIVALFTMPRSGYGKIVESHTANASINEIGGDVVEYFNDAKDRAKYYESMKDVYSREGKDPENFSRIMQRRYKRMGVDYRQDILPNIANVSKYRLRNQQGRIVLVLQHELADYESAIRYASQITDSVNKNRKNSEAFVEERFQDGVMFVQKKKTYDSDCYFVNDKKMMMGWYGTIRDSLSTMERDKSIYFMTKAKRYLRSESRKLGSEHTGFFRARFYSPMSHIGDAHDLILKHRHAIVEEYKAQFGPEKIDKRRLVEIEEKLEKSWIATRSELKSILASYVANKLGTQCHLYENKASSMDVYVSIFSDSKVFFENANIKSSDLGINRKKN